MMFASQQLIYIIEYFFFNFVAEKEFQEFA